MKQYTLIQAIQVIAKLLNVSTDAIQMCQFEDGSGYKFNYTYNGENRFIDLSKHNYPSTYSWKTELFNIYMVLSFLFFIVMIGMAFNVIGTNVEQSFQDGVSYFLLASIVNFIPLYLVARSRGIDVF